MKFSANRLIHAPLLTTLIWSAAYNIVFASTATEAAGALLKRVVPSMAGKILFVQPGENTGKDFFELESKNGKVVITGNDANSMAVGLNHLS